MPRVGAQPCAATTANRDEQSSLWGVDGELTLPAIPGQELGAQSTHQLTLKLTEPIVGRTHSHTRRICLGGRKKMNSDTWNFALKRSAPNAVFQFTAVA